MSGPTDDFVSDCPAVRSADPVDCSGYVHSYRGELEAETRTARILTLAPGVTAPAVTDAFTRAVDQWHNPSTHPNVVSVYDRAQRPRPWVAVEAVDGERLPVVQPEISIPELRTIITESAEALRNANLYNTTHHALRPEHVWVQSGGDDTDNTVLVDNWGIQYTCRVAAGESPVNAFTAPELLGEATATGQTDVYGLGAIAYYLVTGRPPVVGADLRAAVTAGDITPPSKISDAPAEIDGVVLEALATDPVDRQETCHAFSARFREALPDTPQTHSATDTSRNPGQHSRQARADSGADGNQNSPGNTAETAVQQLVKQTLSYPAAASGDGIYETLQSEDENARTVAARALNSVSSQDPTRLQDMAVLLEYVEDDNREVRNNVSAAACQLAVYGCRFSNDVDLDTYADVSTRLVSRVQDGDRKTVERSIEVLSHLLSPQHANLVVELLPDLVDALDSENDRIRVGAANLIATCAVDRPALVWHSRDTLRQHFSTEQHTAGRLYLAGTLALVTADDSVVRSAVERLEQGLESERHTETAVEQLARVAQARPTRIESVVGSLGKHLRTDPDTNAHAARALRAVAVQNPTAVAPLVQDLNRCLGTKLDRTSVHAAHALRAVATDETVDEPRHDMPFFILAPRAAGKSHLIYGLYFAAVSKHSQTVPLSVSEDLVEMLAEDRSHSSVWPARARGRGEIEDIQLGYTPQSRSERVRLRTQNYANEYLGRLAEFLTSEDRVNAGLADAGSMTARLLKHTIQADVLVVLADSQAYHYDEPVGLSDAITAARAQPETTVLPVSTKTDVFVEQFRDRTGLDAPGDNYEAFREFVHAQWSGTDEYDALLAESPYGTSVPVYFETEETATGITVLERPGSEGAMPNWVGFDHVLDALSELPQ